MPLFVVAPVPLVHAEHTYDEFRILDGAHGIGLLVKIGDEERGFGYTEGILAVLYIGILAVENQKHDPVLIELGPYNTARLEVTAVKMDIALFYIGKIRIKRQFNL